MTFAARSALSFCLAMSFGCAGGRDAGVGRESEARIESVSPAPETTHAPALSLDAAIAEPGNERGEMANPAPPEVDARPRVYSVAHITWIRPRPEVKEGAYLGYVRTGGSIPLRSPDKVQGPGCNGGFYQVAPHGFICADRTVSTAPREAFVAATRATHGGPGPFPYRYAFSDGAPMYNRIPTRAEQARFERAFGSVDEAPVVPKWMRSHEELAIAEPIVATDAVPDFLAGGKSAKEAPYDLIDKTLPHGSMVSYTRAFEAEGRTWLLSSDHTLVSADRVRAFRPSTFHGVDLAAGEAKLPIAWTRVKARPTYLRKGDAFEKTSHELAVRTWVELSGAEVANGKETMLETRALSPGGSAYWLASSDATVVGPEATLPFGVKEGEKWVLIRLTQGTLVAYQGLTPAFVTLVSPGAGGLPIPGRDNVKDSTTPLGVYRLTFKDRAATMSPEKGKDRNFWIQDVPHTQYFDPPFALHGAYWHERFGEWVSAGCVNLSPIDAEKLFAWTDPTVPEGWQGATGAGAKANGPASLVVLRP